MAMKLHTARQVICDTTGIVAGKIAKSRDGNIEQVIKEAKATIKSARKTEQNRKKENRCIKAK